MDVGKLLLEYRDSLKAKGRGHVILFIVPWVDPVWVNLGTRHGVLELESWDVAVYPFAA